MFIDLAACTVVGKGFSFLLNLITKLRYSRVTATSVEVCYLVQSLGRTTVRTGFN